MELLGILLFGLWVLIVTVCVVLTDGRGHTPEIRSTDPWSAGNLPSEPYASLRMEVPPSQPSGRTTAEGRLVCRPSPLAVLVRLHGAGRHRSCGPGPPLCEPPCGESDPQRPASVGA